MKRKILTGVSTLVLLSVQSSSPHFVMAASLVSLVPVLILFFSAQRYFVKGIALTGIKG